MKGTRVLGQLGDMSPTSRGTDTPPFRVCPVPLSRLRMLSLFQSRRSGALMASVTLSLSAFSDSASVVDPLLGTFHSLRVGDSGCNSYRMEGP